VKNVVFFIGSLALGGAEAKMARNFLPHLKQRGRINPKLLLLQERGYFIDVLPNNIERFSLNETSDTKITSIIPKYKKALQHLNADVVVSCMWYPAIITYIARKLRLCNFKHIVHDTVNMTAYIEDYFRTERFKALKISLIKMAYQDAESMIVVSKGEKKDLLKNFGLKDKKVEVVYNPINHVMISEMAKEDPGISIYGPVIVTAGRLVHQKGLDILLGAFRKVRSSVPCKLLIVGDGEKRDELVNLVRSLKLEEDVIFLGATLNPYKYMKMATVFCLASRYEGLGNVILESMATGAPVVVTDCPSGPAEIVDNGRYGLLVPPEDPDAIADALIRVLSDNELRDTLSKLSLKRAQDFDLETSLKQWENIILAL
jgi:glycosyltransferase involved in cell wall biosynthesis